MTDQEIIQLIRDKNSAERGAKALWDSYHRKLFGYLIGKLSVSHEDADDLRLQTLIKVIDKIQSFKGARDNSFWTWIKSIADNCFIDLYRKNTVRISGVGGGDNLEQSPKREDFLKSSETKVEDGVPVTNFPYAGPPEKTLRTEKYVSLTPEEDEGEDKKNEHHWDEDAVHEIRAEEIDIDKCVSEGLERFAKADQARAFALTLQMDGYSIEQIGIRIGRSASATKQYLYEIRKKIEPYIVNCFDLLKPESA